MRWTAGVARHFIGCRCTQETRVHSALDGVVGLGDIASLVIGCHLTEETRVQSALDNVVGLADMARLVMSHRVPFDLRDEGSECVGRRWGQCPPGMSLATS